MTGGCYPFMTPLRNNGLILLTTAAVVEFLKKKTIPAWGGNRIILDEDWEALLKAVEKDKKGESR